MNGVERRFKNCVMVKTLVQGEEEGRGLDEEDVERGRTIYC